MSAARRAEGNGGRHRHPTAAAFWIVVGVVAVIAFGDTLTLLALVLAVVTTAWWFGREVEHRVKGNGARRYVTGVASRAGHRRRFPSRPLTGTRGPRRRSTAV